MTPDFHSFDAITWRNGTVVMIDQRYLPHKEQYNEYHEVEEVAEAIRTMVIRGAPAIGCAAAFGLALAAHNTEDNSSLMADKVNAACTLLESTRPTAVNLFWATRRMREVLDKNLLEAPDTIRKTLLNEARSIYNEDLELCRSIGRFGNELVPQEATILTHCNAGALATAGHGTALGVVRSASEAGKKIRVFADETRPFLQGARLTAWELSKDGIDVTVIADVAAASLMARGMVNLVIVGTDRVAANGDIANKIGTYGVALAAKANDVPFYVATPCTTIDLSTPTGRDIPIEERPAKEVTHVFDEKIVPDGVPVMNPAFDVTPAELVTALITDQGIVYPPYKKNLLRFRSTNSRQ